MVKLATPVSHLFENKEWAKKIFDHSDVLECRDRSYKNNFGYQELFHSDFQPIHRLPDNFFKYLEKIKKSKVNLKLISFHMASSCDKPKIENGMFQPGGKNYSREELQKNASVNFKIIRNIFGPDVKIAVENNNYYPTLAYQFITEADFINDILLDNDLFLLFDIAHAKVTCHNLKIDYFDYRNKIFLDRAIQLHVCKPMISEGVFYDAHELPDSEILDELKFLIQSFSNINYVTLEYYKNINLLLKELKKIRSLVEV